MTNPGVEIPGHEGRLLGGEVGQHVGYGFSGFVFSYAPAGKGAGRREVDIHHIDPSTVG